MRGNIFAGPISLTRFGGDQLRAQPMPRQETSSTGELRLKAIRKRAGEVEADDNPAMLGAASRREALLPVADKK